MHVLSFLLVVNTTKSIKLLCTTNLLFRLLPSIHNPKVLDFFIKLLDPSDSFYKIEESLFNVFWKYAETTGLLSSIAWASVNPFTNLKTNNFSMDFKAKEIKVLTAELKGNDRNFKHANLRFFFRSLLQNGEITNETVEEVNRPNIDIDIIEDMLVKEPLPDVSPPNEANSFNRSKTNFMRNKNKMKTTIVSGKTNSNGLANLKRIQSKNKIEPFANLAEDKQENYSQSEGTKFKVIDTRKMEAGSIPRSLSKMMGIQSQDEKGNKSEEMLIQIFKAGYRFYPEDSRLLSGLETEFEEVSMRSDFELKADSVSCLFLQVMKNSVKGGLSVSLSGKMRKELNLASYEMNWFWDAVFKQKESNFLDALFKNYLCKIKQAIEKNDSSVSGFMAGEILNFLLANRHSCIEITLHTKIINQTCLQNLQLFHYVFKKCFEVLDLFPEKRQKASSVSQLPKVGRSIRSSLKIPSLTTATKIEPKEKETGPSYQLGVFRILLAETLVLFLETKGTATASVRSKILLSIKDSSVDIMIHWFFCFK